jgi:hypothetical protein
MHEMASSASGPSPVDASGSDGVAVSLEQIVDCPFSLAVSDADLVLPIFATPGGALRIPYRALGLPFPGALTRPVTVEFVLKRDPTEPGRVHDEIDFGWNAQTRWLPNFHGVLRFRMAAEKTRLLLDGSYGPPFGGLGALFDRLIGHRLALETMTDLLNRLAQALEERWRKEQRG